MNDDNNIQDIESWPLPNFTNDETAKVTDVAYGSIGNKAIVEEVEEVPELTLEDITKMYEDSREEGLNLGFKDGQAKGIKQGFDEGIIQGKEEGYQQGLQQGLIDGQKQIDSLTNHWVSLIDKIYNPLNKVDQQVENELVSMILILVKEITKVEVKTNSDVILKTVKEAISVLPITKAKTEIYLNPNDMQTIEEIFPIETREKKNWHLIADGSINSGDCNIESDMSSVNIEMEKVIQQVLKKFITVNSNLNNTIDNRDEFPIPEVQVFAPTEEAEQVENSEENLEAKNQDNQENIIDEMVENIEQPEPNLEQSQ